MVPRRAEASAPAKLILVGEHAVVHGYPALVLPFAGVRAFAELAERPGPAQLAAWGWQGALEAVPEQLAGFAECVRATLARLGEAPEGFVLRLSSEIAPGSGLGASAALAVAVVRALYAAFAQEPTHDDLTALAAVAERHAHGNPSGVDVAGVLASGPIRFVRDTTPQPLDPGGALHLVVADTGRPSATRKAVAALQQRLELEDEGVRSQLVRLGELADEACGALLAGDRRRLGQTLDQAQTSLAALALSDDALDALVTAARTHGALGAKLTGGGCGGCMLALAENAAHQDDLVRALEAAGARQVWRHTVIQERIPS
ncbi:MAG TPA: mevalonate kinase [Oscillatoriaceae cyanobacterium]